MQVCLWHGVSIIVSAGQKQSAFALAVSQPQCVRVHLALLIFLTLPEAVELIRISNAVWTGEDLILEFYTIGIKVNTHLRNVEFKKRKTHQKLLNDERLRFSNT